MLRVHGTVDEYIITVKLEFFGGKFKRHFKI